MDDIIAVDTRYDSNDAESTYSSDLESDTTSVASSIFNYRYEHGRRYHAYREGTYVLPNDEPEQDRLDMYHNVWMKLFDGALHQAPLRNPQRILDIGTGTGIWAIDMGDLYPEAQVVATDLSPIQPAWVPPNVEFFIEDCETPWSFSNDSFDFIQLRCLGGAIKNWDLLLAECYQHLKPGGWIEVPHHDFHLKSDDGTYHDKLRAWEYYERVNKAAESLGRPFELGHEMGSFLENAGFTDIHHITKKLPIGSWPKDKEQKMLGLWLELICETGFEAFGTALLTRVAKMDLKDVQELVSESLAEIKSRKIHAYNIQHVHYARKPMTS